jgi:lysophospholipase L1-like esterase
MRQFDYKLRTVLRSWKKTLRSDRSDDEFADSRGKRVVFDKQALVDEFEMNLQTYINVCQARRIIPVLMTMASRLKEAPDKEIAISFEERQAQGFIGYQEFKELFDLFNESIRKKAMGNKILLIDLAREIPQEKDYMWDIVHFNNRGSIKAARIISEHLKPLIIQKLQK